MKIKYSEDFGELKFTCNKDGHKLSDIIPDPVICRGEKVINEYVTKRMDRHIHQTKKDNIKSKERAERRKNTNIHISLKHAGQNLKGRIIDYRGLGDRGLITIILESPSKYKGDDSIYSCYGMSVAGIRVFNDNGNLTKWALDHSKVSLIEIYERAKKREIAKKLNKN